jgi:uncharacterized protein DUF5671
MSLKKIYLYFVSVISFVLVLWGVIIFFDQAFGGNQFHYSYPCLTPLSAPMVCDQATIAVQREINEADYTASKQRDMAQAIAMLLIATPVAWIHWRLAKRETNLMQATPQRMSLKKVYLYFVSLLTFLLILFGTIGLFDQALKVWVFPLGDQPNYFYPCNNESVSAPVICDQAAIDTQRKFDEADHAASKQGSVRQVTIMLIIVTPVWLIHWRLANKEA